ncbi:MBL fold metallo-hydrolase [Alkalihalobacillus deserti]|uniref:MBL fold metallo-hydrolase n=1 Tax=Alkalihalobacillus deserti TaxID=2879466 RepID=UPI001D15C8FD|nr:MBL fold metallo-hydrolase [Alkalihalobacillus deserti]
MQKDRTIKIIRVPIQTPTLWPHTETNCYLIGNDKESLLVDAGYDHQTTKKELERAILENSLAKPKSIILTHSHPDHALGVRQLIDWSPIVYCHNDEKQAIMAAISPVNELSILNDDDIIRIAGLDITVIHTPGHTAGHLSLYIASEEILIAGDNIVTDGTTWIGPPDGDMTDYVHTLNRLKQLKITKIGPGHGEWVLNPHEQIEFVLERRLYRESQIKSLLKEHKQLTSNRLTNLIYKNTIHPSIYEVAKRTTEAHLIKLMKEDHVSLKDSVYSLRS